MISLLKLMAYPVTHEIWITLNGVNKVKITGIDKRNICYRYQGAGVTLTGRLHVDSFLEYYKRV